MSGAQCPTCEHNTLIQGVCDHCALRRRCETLQKERDQACLSAEQWKASATKRKAWALQLVRQIEWAGLVPEASDDLGQVA